MINIATFLTMALVYLLPTMKIYTKDTYMKCTWPLKRFLFFADVSEALKPLITFCLFKFEQIGQDEDWIYGETIMFTI